MGRRIRPVAFAVASLCLAASALAREPLTFEERVKAQEAIERVYYNHRIWPKENHQPKPPFEKNVPREVLEAKVTDCMKKCAALDKFWQRQIQPHQLQAEMDRMTEGSRDRATLQELFRALGDDPLMVAECLARPALAGRLILESYSYDRQIHASVRETAEMALRLIGQEDIAPFPGAEFNRMRYLLDDERSQNGRPEPEEGIIYLGLEGFAEMERTVPEIGQAALKETDEALIVVRTISLSEGEIETEALLFRKRPFGDWWGEISPGLSAENPLDEGFGYTLPGLESAPGPDFADIDSWAPTSLVASPSARCYHTAVWTGAEMIVWGGYSGQWPIGTGGCYDPATDTWRATSSGSNCPTSRYYHTAVWSGTEMVIWGGYDNYNRLNSGGRYDPVLDTWSPTSTSAGCPAARIYHTAVWSGSEMIIWGGNGGNFLNSGGRYNPATETWTATSTGGNCPSGRQWHAAVMAGAEIIVWGGTAGYYNLECNTGGRYNPATDTWLATSTGAACPVPRYWHTAIWTGGEMIVWGGFSSTSSGNSLNSGGMYNPTSNSWAATPTSGCPSARANHSAVWTDDQMIVWGGGWTNTGGRYDLATGTWTGTSTGPYCPSSRGLHTAIWTGAEMIIWGGEISLTCVNTGGRYFLNCDSPSGLTNNTASDPNSCIGVVISWAADPASWGDPWAGYRSYCILRDDAMITGAIPYGTTQYTDETATPGQSYNYKVRYINSCGLFSDTAGADVTDDDSNVPSVTISGPDSVCQGESATLDAGPGFISYLWSPGGETTQTIQVTPLSTTLYGVTVSNGICPASATHTVTLFPNYTPAVSAGDLPSEPRDELWITNGRVYTAAASEGTLYVGGDFTLVAPNTGSGIGIDGTTGLPDLTYAKVNGDVSCVIPDGAGGWYIGGLFTRVGKVVRNRMAHILPDHTLDESWDSNPDNSVSEMVLVGSTLYVGGAFQNIGGQPRSYIAALDASTGLATGWNPILNGSVLALAVSGSTLYIGGSFTTAGGQSHVRLAALDIGSGSVLAWNPSADNSVNTLAVSGGIVYAGGLFHFISGLNRNHLAAIDAIAGTVTAWNPDPNNIVSAITVSGSTVYVGGTFTYVGSNSRNRIAALDALTGIATPWNPNANSNVYTLAVAGSTVYAGGLFTSIGSKARNYIAAIDSTTGISTDWNPNANSHPHALATTGSAIYAGGSFTTMGGVTRNRIAALDIKSGAPTAWDPNANNIIYELLVSGQTVYVGGYFTAIGGQPRNRIAAIDTITGLATAWNPDANNGVRALAISGSTVYAGGGFTTINGQTRNGIAAIDATTGIPTVWDPNSDGTVYTIAISGETLYIGGYFTSIGGQSRNMAAALSKTTGAANSWNPNADARVHAIAVSGPTIYVGGEFTNIGGLPRKQIAALDATYGIATDWNPNAGWYTSVFALAVSWPTVYVGGGFSSIGGQARYNLAALDAISGTALPWAPNPTGGSTDGVWALALYGSLVFAGGEFRTAGEELCPNLAEFDLYGSGPYLCPDAPRLLTSSEALTYQWFKDGSPLPGETSKTYMASQPGSFSVGVTYAGGCSNTSAALDLKVPPVPTISGANANTCPSISVPLSTEPGMNSYQWYRDSSPISGATGMSLDVTSSGFYTVSYTDGGDCTVTSPAHEVTIVICPPPPPVADGKLAGTAAKFAKNASLSDQIDVTYDTAPCSYPKAAILYGQIGAYSGYTGCALPDAWNSGAAAFDAQSLDNVWFNIIWTTGGIAGHPGYAFQGGADIERIWSAAGFCGLSSDDHGDKVCN